MKIHCETCGREFDRSASHIRRRQHQYCSKACGVQGRARRSPQVSCCVCGRVFYKYPSAIKASEHNFCGRDCFHRWRHLASNRYDETGALIERRCSQCKRWLHPSKFYKSTNARVALDCGCTDCLKKKTFGIDDARLASLLREIACAICDSPDHLGIDHNHATGEVRHRLCLRCNTVLGLVQESTQLLQYMSHYITKHNKTRT